jgi:hypothetical protein
MKLLIAVITFALTLGGLFLIETTKSPKENYAQIIEALKEGNTSTVVSAAPSPARTRNQFQTPASTPTSVEAGLLQGMPTPVPQKSPTMRQMSTPTPTQTLGPIPTSTPIQTSAPQSTLAPTSTYLPTTTPTPMPAAGHIFYTSSYRTTKYYYCDTDNGWKNLSSDYLKSYPSESALLQDYPARILHEPCK